MTVRDPTERVYPRPCKICSELPVIRFNACNYTLYYYCARCEARVELDRKLDEQRKRIDDWNEKQRS